MASTISFKDLSEKINECLEEMELFIINAEENPPVEEEGVRYHNDHGLCETPYYVPEMLQEGSVRKYTLRKVTRTSSDLGILADDIELKQPLVKIIYRDDKVVKLLKYCTYRELLDRYKSDPKLNKVYNKLLSMFRRINKLNTKDRLRVAQVLKGYITHERSLVNLYFIQQVFTYFGEKELFNDLLFYLLTPFGGNQACLPSFYRKDIITFIRFSNAEIAAKRSKAVLAVPEMDGGGSNDTSELAKAVDEVPQSDKEGNIVLTDAAPVVVNEVPEQVEVLVADLKMNEIENSAERLTDQWMRFGRGREITTQDVPGSIMFVDDLPKDCILENICAPPVRPFENHAYFSADLRIKIQINSTQFQSGLYVVGFRYFERGDDDDPIVTAAQVVTLNSTFIHLLNSSTGELRVKFVCPLSALPTRNSSLGYGLSLGSLYFACLEPLSTGSNGQKTAKILYSMALEMLNFMVEDIDRCWL